MVLFSTTFRLILSTWDHIAIGEAPAVAQTTVNGSTTKSETWETKSVNEHKNKK